MGRPFVYDESIRNFSIIAHIDHGKSPLADRMIQRSGVVDARNFKDRSWTIWTSSANGAITIKSQAITLPYQQGRRGIHAQSDRYPGPR
jgi:GTP-binding protein LepA